MCYPSGDMGMLEPTWNQRYPTPSDIRRMWEEISFEPVVIDHPALDELLDALRRTRVQGGVLLGCFRVSEHRTFDYFASRNGLLSDERDDKVGFSRRFLSSPAVATALPQLSVDSPAQDWDIQFPPLFEWASSLTLDGELAERLVLGGAYHVFPGTPAESKSLGQRFCAAMFGTRYDEVRGYRSFERWHGWFHYVEHTTWLLIDKRRRNIWLLCLTDLDRCPPLEGARVGGA